MNNIAEFCPNWISSPSQTIKDVLQEKQLTTGDFSRKMNFSEKFIISLLNDDENITVEVAERLETVLGGSKRFWINRENQYREYLEIFNKKQEDNWIKELPIKDMIKNGWISNTGNLFSSCLDFFGIRDLKSWRFICSEIIPNYNFRTSKSFNANIASLATWIRQGEIIANNIECKEWDSTLFLETLCELKSLTRLKRPQDFLPRLINECSKCGVAIAIVPNPNGSRASGATKFIDNDKALMILSFRFLSDDHFWFTFFHEAGHLIMQHKSRRVFIDIENETNFDTDEEKEANIFAQEMLVPETFRAQLYGLRSNKRRIISFSQEVGVSPGIVIGQMQHYGIIAHSYLNSYKRHFEWSDVFEGIANHQSINN